jgi:transcriptional regulator with XRE-family HTH domain
METRKRKALEAAGYRFTDAATFVGMTEEERALLHARLALAKAVRRARQARQLTQKQLAERIGSSQLRVARLEQAGPDVTFDLILKALAAVGVRLSVTDHNAGRADAADEPAAGKKRKERRRARSRRKTGAPTSGPQVPRVEFELIGRER